MKSRQLRIWVPLLLLAAGAVTLGACSHRSAETPAPARAVTVTPVVEATLGDTVRTVGLLTPKDEARLAFKVSGVIESIRVEEGAAVKAGQLLAILKQAEIGSAVEQARQAADKAARDLARGKALYADGVATEEQVQDLTTAARVAAAALRSAEFNARYTRIEAPADGVVLRKLAEPNELVQPGQPVLVLGGNGRGWIVRTSLADRDVVRVRLGDAVQLAFDAWPGRAFSGRISNVSSAAEPATGTFPVEIQVEAGAEHFVQGLVAKVSLAPQAGPAPATPVVPLQALLEANGDQAFVFVVDVAAQRAHRVAVHIGRLADARVEVVDGLKAGEQVVVDGAAFLVDGEAVRLVPTVGPAARVAPAASVTPAVTVLAPAAAIVPAASLARPHRAG
jgi:membrane fusion protein, multidrug efflux system